LRQSQQNFSTSSRYTPLKRGGVSVNDAKTAASPVTLPSDSQTVENKASNTPGSTSTESEIKVSLVDIIASATL
jgi:hypothetical protein